MVTNILFACTPVDDPTAVGSAFLPAPDAASGAAATTGAPAAWRLNPEQWSQQPPPALAALKAVGSFWDEDTGMRCYEGPMRWLLAMGIVWAALFCAGFPLAMALALARCRRRLRDPQVGRRCAAAARAATRAQLRRALCLPLGPRTLLVSAPPTCLCHCNRP